MQAKGEKARKKESDDARKYIAKVCVIQKAGNWEKILQECMGLPTPQGKETEAAYLQPGKQEG